MGPWALAQLMALLFLASPGLANSPDDGAARSLEDLIRASDLIVLGRVADADGPTAPVRLEVTECLLGSIAPETTLTLAAETAVPDEVSLWMLSLDQAGHWALLEATPRHPGWSDEVRTLIGTTGLRLTSMAMSSARGEPALFKLILRNQGDSPRRFPAQLLADGRIDIGSLNLLVDQLTTDGPVSMIGRPRIARIAASEGVTLGSGDTLSAVLDLTELVDLCNPGTYRILLVAPAPWGAGETRLLIR